MSRRVEKMRGCMDEASDSEGMWVRMRGVRVDKRWPNVLDEYKKC